MMKILFWIRTIVSGPELSKEQWRFLAQFLKTIAEGIVLGSSAAFFLPETFQLIGPISIERYLLIMVIGLIFLVAGAIMIKRGKND